MDTSRALTLRLLLVVATASLGTCLGDQCSVVHYLAAGEVREFAFRSGSQFVDNLNCIFSFSAPSDHHITLAVSDLDMAPPSAGSNNKTSCVDDVLTIYNLTGGQLQAIGSYCGNNATLNSEFDLSSNIAVVSFVSHESSTPRRFTLTLKAVQKMQQTQQNGYASGGQKEVETGPGEGQENAEEGEGNGEEEGEGNEEEEGAGEEETTTEPGEGEEEAAEGEVGEEGEEGDVEEGSDEGEEATGNKRRGGKAVSRISAIAPGQGSVSGAVQQRAMRKPRSQQDDRQNTTDKSRRKRTEQKKWQTAQAKVSTLRAVPAHNRAQQEDSHTPLHFQQHTPQLSGHRMKAKRQLQPRRHTVQLCRRSRSLQPVGNNLHHKHSMTQQKQKLRDNKMKG